MEPNEKNSPEEKITAGFDPDGIYKIRRWHIDTDFKLTTVETELALTPMASRLLSALIAEAKPEAMLVNVSPDNTV